MFVLLLARRALQLEIIFDFFPLSLARCSLLQEPLKVAQKKMETPSHWLEKHFSVTQGSWF